MKKYEHEKEVIINKDYSPPDKIIIIFCGKVFYDNNLNKEIGGRGDLLAEDFILNQSKILHNIVRGKQSVITIEANINDIIPIISKSILNNQPGDSSPLSSNLSILLDFYERISHLKQIQIFKNISDSKLLQIGKLMIKKKYNKGDVIIQENTEGKYIFFLYKGKVHILNNRGKKIREYQDCVCFGEISLLTNKPHTATVVAAEEAYTYLLAKKDFDIILDNIISFAVKGITSKCSIVPDSLSLTIATAGNNIDNIVPWFTICAIAINHSEIILGLYFILTI